MAEHRKRGFAAMNPEKQREIASKGGKEAHRQGTAHEFSSEEARAAGRLGGKTMGENRVHMATIGRKGGQRSTARRRSSMTHEQNGNNGHSQLLPLVAHDEASDLPHTEFGRSIIEKSIDVNVPVHIAYHQLTQFEKLPRFMEGIEEVQQLDEQKLQWRANLEGNEKQWTTIISEQVPNQRIAWRDMSDSTNTGIVTFHPIGNSSTRITVLFDYDAKRRGEDEGVTLGGVSHRVQNNLQRFKDLVEAGETEADEWEDQVRRLET